MSTLSPIRQSTQTTARRRAFTLVASAWVVGFLCLVALVNAGPANAHAQVLATSPTDGQVVATAPSEVTVTFDEAVEAYDEALKVFAPDGAAVATGGQVRDKVVSLALPDELANGTYVVSWRVTSTDSHVISGGFTFSIGAPSATTASPDAVSVDIEPGLQLALYLLQAISYAAVLLVAGLAVFRIFVLPDGLTKPLQKIQGLVTKIGLTGIAALLLGLPLASAALSTGSLTSLAKSETWTDQFATDLGFAALLGISGLALCIWATQRVRTPASVTALIIGACIAVGSFALVGHTRTRGFSWLMVSMDLLHLAVAAIWLGGLVGLLTVLWRSKTQTRTDNATLAALTLARFSGLASAVVALLVAAGVILAAQILQSFDAVFSTSYGVTLLVKIAFALVTVAVAAWNRFWLLPRVQVSVKNSAAWQLIRRAVAIEVALLLVILLVTAVMVNQNPNMESQGSDQAATQVEQQLGDATLKLTVTPSKVGTNSMEFILTGSNGNPVELTEPPSVRITLPSMDIAPLDRTVTKTGPGTYLSNSDFPMPGEWEVVVSARLSKYENPVTRIKVQVSE